MAESNKPKSEYLLEDPDEIEEVEAGEYVVEGFVPQSEVTFVCGPAKHLKTFLVPSWVLCAATGQEWFGHKVKRCKVVYNIGEGSDAFMGRIKAWQIHNGVPRLEGYFKVLRRMINLFDPIKFVAAVNKIKAWCRNRCAPRKASSRSWSLMSWRRWWERPGRRPIRQRSNGNWMSWRIGSWLESMRGRKAGPKVWRGLS